jgi:hypothetical protein
MKKEIKIIITFPDDFIKINHPFIPNAFQWLSGNNDKIISIVGGGAGLYGNVTTSFEMMHPAMKGDVQGWMSIEEINKYISEHPL